MMDYGVCRGDVVNHGFSRMRGANACAESGEATRTSLLRLVSCGLIVMLLAVPLALRAAEPTISVTATPRYPWSGMVDLAFTITGDSGMKFDTSFVAKDVAGGTNLTMKTIYKSNGSSAALTNSLTAGSYRWTWNAAADLPNNFVCERVTVVGEVKEKYPMDSGNGTTFIPGTYLILNLNTFSIETRDNVTSASEFNTDTFRQTKMVFRKIPAGSFMMQQNGATPAVKVTLAKDFYMSIFECTITQYRKLGGNFDNDNTVPAYASWNTLAGKNGIISKFNAKLSTTGYQANLPSEAQWERAARAGSTSACYFNSVKGSLGNYAWYTDNASWEIRKPGLKLPNAWGLYDMYGNADEWCLDLYDSWDKVAAKQPGGPNSSSYASRVSRGGAYCYASYFCSSIYRNASDPSSGGSVMGNHDAGFRFVLVAK